MARPELDRLRDDARGGRLQAVLINDVDRLARDVSHLGVIKRDLERNNVRVIFRKLPSETGPMSNLMVNILGSFAEFERELIIDRTRRGRRHKVEHRRQYLGSNTAYGYRYQRMDRMNGRAGRLDVEPHEAQLVRQMFKWVDAEHLSAGGVARRLNDECQRPRKSILWGKSSVLRILHNEMYAGVWHYNKFQCCEPRQHRVQVPYRKRVKSSLKQRCVKNGYRWSCPQICAWSTRIGGSECRLSSSKISPSHIGTKNTPICSRGWFGAAHVAPVMWATLATVDFTTVVPAGANACLRSGNSA